MAAVRAVQSHPKAHCWQAGQIIAGKYRIDDVLGEGGMGIVYQAWNLFLETEVAVKVVRPEYFGHREAAQQMVNEARTMAHLRGAHVGRVLDVDATDDKMPFIVLEYLRGDSLRALLDAQGCLPVAQSVDYVLQVCEAMAEAHAVGIVHCDLKPDNLILARAPDGTQTLKVIDFGISRRTLPAAGEAMAGAAVGSPYYMAPEQLMSPATIDARTDIWALGIVLFELLTGDVPFNSASVTDLRYSSLFQAPPSLRSQAPDVPVGLEMVVLKCLEKLPEARYPSVTELADALLPFAEEPCAESVRRIHRVLRHNCSERLPLARCG